MNCRGLLHWTSQPCLSFTLDADTWTRKRHLGWFKTEAGQTVGLCTIFLFLFSTVSPCIPTFPEQQYISLSSPKISYKKSLPNIASKCKPNKIVRFVTLRKWFGTRLHKTGVRNWTCSRGGHWGTGFFLSLLNRPADRGITFWKGNRLTMIQHRIRQSWTD